MVLSGKHVLCEKPMVTSLADARILRRAVRTLGVNFTVGNVNRFVPQFDLAARYSHEGRLGDIFFVESNYIHDMRNVFIRTPWRIDPKRPQNAIFGGGVHPIDLIRWVVDSEVAEVFCYSNHKTIPVYNEADNILISIKFANGCIGKVWITFGIRRYPEHVVDLNIFGSEGTIYSNSETSEARFYDSKLTEPQHGWKTIPFKTVKGHPFREELVSFIESIRSKRDTMVNVTDGAFTVAIMEAAQRSSESGQPEQIEDIDKPLSTKEQLLMWRPNLENLPIAKLQDGYSIRNYQPGDEQAWLDICNPAINMTWNMEDLKEKLINVSWFTPEHLLFVCHQQNIVGTACAWQLRADEKKVGYVHMVAVRPEYRGKGLGRLLTLKVLHYLKKQGFRESKLNTDEFRLPAISLYLDLGFKPVIKDDSIRQRWSAVKAALGKT
jgi:predicted dehydrogenase/ribosomal protein S18 acetylase RimI-like enzyme